MLEFLKRGLAIKKDDQWYIKSCCGRCNGIDDVCMPSEYKLHPSNYSDFDLVHKHKDVRDLGLWTFYLLTEEEDFVGGCGHTGYPTHTTYAKLSDNLEPPSFMNIKELDNITDF
jgi:hypothetical protein